MSSSLRARRMARNHKRMARPPRLNLVALMDIFTILVLFLIVNNGDVEVLQPARDVTLPDSVSERRPQPALIIRISDSELFADGVSVASLGELDDTPGNTLPPLADALRRAANLQAQEQDLPGGRPVVIMGDRDTPYALLKRVMATCAASDYRNVSLAVNSVAQSGAESSDTGLAVAGSAP
ncbi:MAG: biopolymer transporter ExbD [Halioglobus sp.]|nr:biopolymer transporter ExbD [Halioglobus sp.]